MEKRKLKISGIYKRYPLEEFCVLILKETEGRRNLLIRIGVQQSEAILIHLENIKPERPLVHDLFFARAESLDATLEEVIIYKYSHRVFYAKMILLSGGIEKMIEAHTPDAIALALRFNAPVYTYESLLQKKGVIEKNTMNEMVRHKTVTNRHASYHLSPDDLAAKHIRELKSLLKRAVDEEAYELAGQIRDELLKRKNNLKE